MTSTKDIKTPEEVARDKAEEIRASAAKDKEKRDLATNEALKGLDRLRQNSALSQMYQESANVGADNLASELPILKVHSTGKSKSLLADGSKPKDGAFYYRPTQSQYDDVMSHILTVSRGFYAAGIPDPKTGISPIKWNHIVGGVMLNDGDMKPFYMYFTGVKVSKLWDFGKEVGKYVKSKSFPIPMFALTVHMTAESVSSKSFGDNWVVNFEVMTEEGGSPLVIEDVAIFQGLKTRVKQMEETIAQIIATKEVAKPGNENVQTVQAIDEEEPEEIKEPDVVNPDEIPF